MILRWTKPLGVLSIAAALTIASLTVTPALLDAPVTKQAIGTPARC